MSVVDRVYANALFEAALDRDRLATVREQLQQVVEAEAQVPELRELLRNPQLDPRARAAAIGDVLGDAAQGERQVGERVPEGISHDTHADMIRVGWGACGPFASFATIVRRSRGSGW